MLIRTYQILCLEPDYSVSGNASSGVSGIIQSGVYVASSSGDLQDSTSRG